MNTLLALLLSLRQPKYVLILILCTCTVQAQQKSVLNERISLVLRADRDSIVLRWAPSGPGLWLETKTVGYIIERGQVDSTGKLITSSVKRLNEVPIMPWALDEWKKRGAATEKNNRYAAIAVQLLYGKKFTVSNSVSGTGEIAMLRDASLELENRFGFALISADNNTFAANGLGLRFVDTSVAVGKRYTYRVYLAVPSKQYNVESGYATTVAAPFFAEQPAITLQTEGLDSRISLQWQLMGTLGYTGYNIYRSADSGRTFKSMSTTPITGLSGDSAQYKPVIFVDTTITNYRLYRYRVTGITPFADETLPLEVATFGRDLTPPPAPSLDKPEQTGKASVKLKWSMPKVLPKDLAGFVVMRSSRSLEGFMPLPRNAALEDAADTSGTTYEGKRLPPTARDFTDTDATEEEPYYVVAAVDTAKNRAVSLSAYAIIQEREPPKAPTGLLGSIDSLGVVSLRWNLADEASVVGYRVYRANDPTREFTLLTGDMLRDTVFKDTISLNTLTKSVFYRVAALDKRYVVSKPSRILTIKRPDIVPPVQPTFTSVVVRDTAVVLAWQPSASDDVSFQTLSRRTPSTPWQTIKVIPAFERTYSDASIAQQTEYEYRLVAVDSAGLRSEPSVTVTAHTYEQGLKQSVTGLKATYDSTSSSVLLQWQYAPSGTQTSAEKEWFIVYRARDNQPLEEFEAVALPSLTFRDRINSTAQITYRYAICPTNGRSKAPLSPAVSVKIP
jgi:uncharacterized protein